MDRNGTNKEMVDMFFYSLLFKKIKCLTQILRSFSAYNTVFLGCLALSHTDSVNSFVSAILCIFFLYLETIKYFVIS